MGIKDAFDLAIYIVQTIMEKDHIYPRMTIGIQDNLISIYIENYIIENILIDMINRKIEMWNKPFDIIEAILEQYRDDVSHEEIKRLYNDATWTKQEAVERLAKRYPEVFKYHEKIKTKAEEISKEFKIHLTQDIVNKGMTVTRIVKEIDSLERKEIIKTIQTGIEAFTQLVRAISSSEPDPLEVSNPPEEYHKLLRLFEIVKIFLKIENEIGKIIYIGISNINQNTINIKTEREDTIKEIDLTTDYGKYEAKITTHLTTGKIETKSKKFKNYKDMIAWIKKQNFSS